MRLRQLPLVTHGNSSRKQGSACERGFIFCNSLLCHTCGGNEVSLVIPKDARVTDRLAPVVP